MKPFTLIALLSLPLLLAACKREKPAEEKIQSGAKELAEGGRDLLKSAAEQIGDTIREVGENNDEATGDDGN